MCHQEIRSQNSEWKIQIEIYINHKKYAKHKGSKKSLDSSVKSKKVNLFMEDFTNLQPMYHQENRSQNLEWKTPIEIHTKNQRVTKAQKKLS